MWISWTASCEDNPGSRDHEARGSETATTETTPPASTGTPKSASSSTPPASSTTPPAATSPQPKEAPKQADGAKGPQPPAEPKKETGDPRNAALEAFKVEVRKLSDDVLIKFLNDVSKATDLTPEKFDALVDALPALDANAQTDRQRKDALKLLFRRQKDNLSNRPETDLTRVAADVLRERFRPNQQPGDAKQAIAKADAKVQQEEQLKKLLDEQLLKLQKDNQAKLDALANQLKGQLGDLNKAAADAAKNSDLNKALQDALADSGAGQGAADTGAGSGDTGSGSGSGDSGSGDTGSQSSPSNNDRSSLGKDRGSRESKKNDVTSPSSTGPQLAEKKEEPKVASLTPEKKKAEPEKKALETPKLESDTAKLPEAEVANPSLGAQSARRQAVSLGQSSALSPIANNGVTNLGSPVFDSAPTSPSPQASGGLPPGGGFGGEDPFQGLGAAKGYNAPSGNFTYIKTGPNDWIASSGAQSTEVDGNAGAADDDGDGGYGRKKPSGAPETSLTTTPPSSRGRGAVSGGSSGGGTVEAGGIFVRQGNMVKDLCWGARARTVGICSRKAVRTTLGRGLAAAAAAAAGP